MIRSFSVIVPVLNKENEIIRTLESIESSIAYFFQHYEGTDAVEPEVIVVNEGSSDRTLELVSEFAQTRPHYTIVNHFKSLGIGPARNTGTKVSKGDILFFFDGDDLVFKEHIYLCFRVLNHQPAQDSEPFFALPMDQGVSMVELPKQPVGFIRTGVHMKDELNPHWKVAIENTIMQNLCIQRECHEFVEGFPESPIYKQLRCCEDIAYGYWINRFFRSHRIPLETVEYIRYPGNAFDRQLKKFQTPPDQYQDDTPPACRELHRIRLKYERDKLSYLLEKFKKVEKSTNFLGWLNWEQLLGEYLTQKDYVEAIALYEQSNSLELDHNPSLKTVLAVAYNNLGSHFHQQKDLDQAGNYFKKAIALNPAVAPNDLARVYYNVAAVLRDQQEFGQSLSFLQKSLELDAQMPEAIAAIPAIQYKAQIATKGYQFTGDRLSPTIPIWENLLQSYAGKPGLKVLEVGSSEGQITCWLVDKILTHESARITWVGKEEDALAASFDANLAKTGAAEKLRKMLGQPPEILRSLIPNSYHVVHINSDCAASDLLEGILLSWGLLQKAGLLILSGYEVNPASMPEPAAKTAIEAFTNIFNHKLKPLHQSDFMVLQKVDLVD